MPWEGMLGKCWNGYAMCWLFVQGWAKGVAGVWLTSSGRAQGGRGAGVWDACCGAVRRLLGGGQARVCRGEGVGVMCNGAVELS